MRIALVGVNHQTASVSLRERVAIASDQLSGCLRTATAFEGVDEALILCTCNRSELYLALPNGISGPRPQDVFAHIHQIDPALIEPSYYVREDAEAVVHMFRVAAGVDSLVLGETEIIGQLRQAVQSARKAGTAGRILTRLGQKALAAGKRARTETMIGQGCMSVPSVAAELALQVFDDLSEREVLVVGAGEAGRLVARRMIGCGAQRVAIASRSLERAKVLAADIGARPVDFGDLTDELAHADVVITSTSAPHLLITADRLEQHMSRRRGQPMVIIDLAVPRNVDPAVRGFPDLYLYDLDDLQKFVQEAEQQRACELPLVEAITAQEASDFMVWLRSQEVNPLLLSVREQAEAIRGEEMARLQQSVPNLTRKTERAIHLMSKRLVRRLLGQPLERIRQLACEGLSEHDCRLIAELLDLDSATGSMSELGEGPDE